MSTSAPATRVLAVDFGHKRIGLALSDPGRTLAFPRETLERGANADLFARLQTLVAAQQVGQLVVGLPVGLEGQETETTAAARSFGKKLAKALGLPLAFVDERLSSAEAETRLRDAGLDGRQRKKALDAQAAALILETYLQSLPTP